MGSSLAADFLGTAATPKRGLSADFLPPKQEEPKLNADEVFKDPAERAAMREYLVQKGDKGMLQAFDAKYPVQQAPQPAQSAQPGKTSFDAIPGREYQAPAYKEPSLWQKLVGGTEAGASMVTGGTTGLLAGIGSLVDATVKRAGYSLAGIDKSQLPSTEEAFTRGMQAGTYQPRTETGRDMLDTAAKSDAMSALTALAPIREVQLAAAGAKPAAQAVGDVTRSAIDSMKPRAAPPRIEPQLKPRFKVVDGKIVKVEPGQETVVPAEAGQNVVSAADVPSAKSPLAGLEKAPPDVQKAIKTAQARGTLNTEAARRHIEASTLDVPVRLSEGQALLDPRIISEEMNSRAGKGARVSPEFLNQQAKDLAQNLDMRRQAVAPDVTTTNTTQHGQTLIDSAKKADAPRVAAINDAYKALTDAAGGDLPVDGQAFVSNAEAALKKQLKSGAVPASIKSVMEDYKSGRQMTYEDFETLRTDLAQVARESQNGSERAAAKIIRGELEKLPLTPEAEALKPLADRARALAKARFDLMEADPAYAAAVEDVTPIGQESPLADKFVDKHLIGAPRAHIAKFQANVGDQPLAKQTMAAATVDFLRDKARADVEVGKFNAQTYNNTLDRVGPKLDVLVDPDSAAKLQNVGKVAKYVTTQPRGSYVNNSNTLVGAAGDAGAKLARSFLAVKTMGVSEGVKAAVDNVKAARAAKKSVAPGAGVDSQTKLQDIGK